MHEIVKNYYIKMLIRSLKELNIYNEDTKSFILNDLIWCLTEDRIYPHTYATQTVSGFVNENKYFEIDKLYNGLIFDRFYNDLSSYLVKKNIKYDKKTLKEKIRQKYLFNYLHNCGLSSNEMDRLSLHFIPEIKIEKMIL